jgi:hypothetical protein
VDETLLKHVAIVSFENGSSTSSSHLLFSRTVLVLEGGRGARPAGLWIITILEGWGGGFRSQYCNLYQFR